MIDYFKANRLTIDLAFLGQTTNYTIVFVYNNIDFVPVGQLIDYTAHGRGN